MVTIKVGSFLNKSQGSREDFVLNEPIEIDRKDLPLKGNITAQGQLLKLPHEINVQLRNIHALMECICSRCLKPHDHSVDILLAEREFLIDLPASSLEEGENVFFIKNHEIHLDEMLREELLLHFPSIAVCSESCKGLCDQCGVNLNNSTCNCQRKVTDQISPFQNLPLYG